MIDVMVDLETMGNGPNAAVAAIGAVAFDPRAVCSPAEGFVPAQTFYANLDLGRQPSRDFDGATVYWWLRQGTEARERLYSPEPMHPSLVLSNFIGWLEALYGRDGVRGAIAWARGAAFDFPILRSLFKDVGLPYPFGFRNEWCARTACAIADYPRPSDGAGVKHDALDDAGIQVVWLTRALARLRGEGL